MSGASMDGWGPGDEDFDAAEGQSSDDGGDPYDQFDEEDLKALDPSYSPASTSLVAGAGKGGPLRLCVCVCAVFCLMPSSCALVLLCLFVYLASTSYQVVNETERASLSVPLAVVPSASRLARRKRRRSSRQPRAAPVCKPISPSHTLSLAANTSTMCFVSCLSCFWFSFFHLVCLGGTGKKRGHVSMAYDD